MSRKKQKRTTQRSRFKRLRREHLDYIEGSKISLEPQVISDISRWMFFAGRLEISGTGAFIRQGDDFIVKRLWLNSTISTSGNVTQPGPAIATRLIDGLQAGFSSSELNLFWHSHTGISAFWSGEDREAVIKKLAHMPQINLCFGSGDVLDIAARIDYLNQEGSHVKYAIHVSVLAEGDSWIREIEQIREAEKNGRERYRSFWEELRGLGSTAFPAVDDWGDGDWGWSSWFNDSNAVEPDDEFQQRFEGLDRI